MKRSLLFYNFLLLCIGLISSCSVKKITEAKQNSDSGKSKLPILIPFREGKLWGYADSTGAIKIRPQYLLTEPFHDNVGQVHDKNGWGLVDFKGEELTKSRYSDISSFYQGLSRVRTNSGWGIINKKAQEIVPTKYSWVELIQDTDKTQLYIRVSNEIYSPNKKYGLFNSSGKQILPVKYLKIEPLGEGYFNATDEFDNYLINSSGKIIFASKALVSGKFQNGLLCILQDNEFGFINKKGEIVVKPQFNSTQEFSENLAAVEKDGKWGYINESGKLIIKPIYKEASEFRRGFAIVKNESGITLINKEGKSVLDTTYEYIRYEYYKNCYYLKEQNKFHLAIIQPESPYIKIVKNNYYLEDSFSEGLAPVSNYLVTAFSEGYGPKGYIDVNGILTIPFKYDNAKSFYNGYAFVNKNGEWGVINKKDSIVVPFKFKSIEALDSVLYIAFARHTFSGDWFYGLTNHLGEEITPIKYTRIEKYKNGMIGVWQKDYMGLISKNGEELLPPGNLPPGTEVMAILQNGLIKVHTIFDDPDSMGYIDRYGRKYFKD
ncbi:WG repeat-containing protein [Adhaeribacter sp. BT258]|uniref:WG repeat-containing protein n=1 Tax=Adhaeribacter terrigena TaxID=2793070 RepID=A0ABS1BY53_9BACT|nr:WG repeat-containing protein [Adhaeribacter terrigena]MBK0402039.1 WG repeat-containing protein [Adhaeribacter terrigena]